MYLFENHGGDRVGQAIKNKARSDSSYGGVTISLVVHVSSAADSYYKPFVYTPAGRPGYGWGARVRLGG